MEGTPDPSVEGPGFARKVIEARELTDKLEKSNWDFDLVPKVYAKNSRADVLAKELVFVHDGAQETIHGRLVTGGFGTRFNLMGPVQSDSVFRIAASSIFDVVKKQTKTNGLREIKEFRELPKAEPVELYNYTNFFSLRDLVFWHILYGVGTYPSTLMIMAKNFPLGKIIQNSMYMPSKPPADKTKPKIMTFDRLVVSFPTKQVEWMEQPLYGGLVRETMQAEYLITLKESKVSHPYLQPAKEGKIRWQGKSWYYRYFVGTTPKDGVTGPGMGPETRKSG
jgi:hypothetical protein